MILSHNNACSDQDIFFFIVTQKGLLRIYKEEGGSVSKNYTSVKKKKKKIFLSQRRLYEYTEAYLQ